jgi:hypothetical protein
MKLSIPLTVIVLATFALGSTAHAWERKGWVKLGEKTVNGRVDRDTIRVGKYDGRFEKLTLAVEKSELELLSFVVTFANGQKWRPNVRYFFREGSRSRVIDLPGDERRIQKIDITYRNLPRGGRATLEVWGLKVVGHDRNDHHRRRH